MAVSRPPANSRERGRQTGHGQHLAHAQRFALRPQSATVWPDSSRQHRLPRSCPQTPRVTRGWQGRGPSRPSAPRAERQSETLCEGTQAGASPKMPPTVPRRAEAESGVATRRQGGSGDPHASACPEAGAQRPLKTRKAPLTDLWVEPGAPVQVSDNEDPGQVLPIDRSLGTGSVTTMAPKPKPQTPRLPRF